MQPLPSTSVLGGLVSHSYSVEDARDKTKLFFERCYEMHLKKDVDYEYGENEKNVDIGAEAIKH